MRQWEGAARRVSCSARRPREALLPGGIAPWRTHQRRQRAGAQAERRVARDDRRPYDVGYHDREAARKVDDDGAEGGHGEVGVGARRVAPHPEQDERNEEPHVDEREGDAAPPRDVAADALGVVLDPACAGIKMG